MTFYSGWKSLKTRHIYGPNRRKGKHVYHSIRPPHCRVKQTAVAAYFTRKKLLPCGFDDQHRIREDTACQSVAECSATSKRKHCWHDKWAVTAFRLCWITLFSYGWQITQGSDRSGWRFSVRVGLVVNEAPLKHNGSRTGTPLLHSKRLWEFPER